VNLFTVYSRLENKRYVLDGHKFVKLRRCLGLSITEVRRGAVGTKLARSERFWITANHKNYVVVVNALDPGNLSNSFNDYNHAILSIFI
jgi:hypothetical protein